MEDVVNFCNAPLASLCTNFLFANSEEGRAPIITLKTQDNIPLSIDDPITFLSENSELLGEVSSWIQVPLLEQYHEICSLKGLGEY